MSKHEVEKLLNDYTLALNGPHPRSAAELIPEIIRAVVNLKSDERLTPETPVKPEGKINVTISEEVVTELAAKGIDAVAETVAGVKAFAAEEGVQPVVKVTVEPTVDSVEITTDATKTVPVVEAAKEEKVVTKTLGLKTRRKK